MPTFTPLGGLSGGDFSNSENSLFGSNSLEARSGKVNAPQFAQLGGSLQNADDGILGGKLGSNKSSLDDKKGLGSQSAEDLDAEELNKDCSHLLSVFNIYKNKENFNASGFFNGGLDTGIEPSLLAVGFDTKE